MTPITLNELRILLDGAVSTDHHAMIQVSGIRTDNRDIKHGDAFVAFVGQRVDGHDFVDDAFDRGASVAIVTKPVKTDKGPIVQVSDPTLAIQQLAKHERASFAYPVVGITGSNGKTTTKQMVASVLSLYGTNTCLYTKGNQNNELGLPITILQRMPIHRSMVLEMGMRGKGQIQDLCTIAKPNIGVITNIGQSHIELLGSQEAIAHAKGELIEALPADGYAILNGDDHWLRQIADKTNATVVWYSLHDDSAHVRASDIKTNDEGMSFEVIAMGERMKMHIPTFGYHNVSNALAAISVGKVTGLTLAQIAEGLAKLEDLSGRLHIVQGRNGSTVIDDCYNASPLSMLASLETLKNFPKPGKKLAVLGDMYELGEYTESGHREVGKTLAELAIDGVVTIGKYANWIADEAIKRGMKNVYMVLDSKSAMEVLADWVEPGATILVKASRGMHLESVVKALSNLDEN